VPEKGLNEIPRAWREQYEKGLAAFERKNLDYAISLLTKVLEQEPGFYECREALRASQFNKAGAGQSGFLKKVFGWANPKLVQAQVAKRSRPLKAIGLAEELLNHDPNNVAAHKVLAEAALAADLPRTAALSLEIAYKHSPRDRNVVMNLAQALSRAGQPGQAARAEAILSELARAYPGDPKIAQALKDAAASRTMSEGGYGGLADGQGSYRDILRDEQASVTIEQEKRDHKPDEVAGRLIADYEARLRKEPRDLRLIRAIAELYADKKDFDKALEYYQRLASGEAADPSLDQAIAETHVRKFDHALAQLDPNAPDYPAQAERIKAEKHAYMLADGQRRVEHYPSDLQLRFHLGQLYFQGGQITEAIQEFQRAQNNPHLRIQALYHLGLCFARRGIHDLAARTFQNALKEKLVFDDEKKDLIYAFGCELEQMGKKAEAIEQFKLIYEADIAYRDVAAKVDAYSAAQ